MPPIELKPTRDDKGNEIVSVPKNTKNSSFLFGSTGCRIEIAEDAVLDGVKFVMEAPGGVIRIGSRSILKNCQIRTGLDCTVTIGARLWMTSTGNFSAGERTSLTIGDDCMFAGGIDIRTDDSHPIFDRATGKRLNQSRSVSIGNHVWLAPSAAVFGGATVGEGSVIGAKSIALTDIPPNCLAVGAPARVVKRNIVWDKHHVSRTAPYYFETSESFNLWESAFAIEGEPKRMSLMQRLPFLRRFA